jgi:hypothetical protein
MRREFNNEVWMREIIVSDGKIEECIIFVLCDHEAFIPQAHREM